MRRFAFAAACLSAAGLTFAQVPDAATLRDAKQAQSQAAARARTLEAQARAARDAAERTRVRVAALVERIGAAEAGITAAEARVRIVERLRAEQRARLAERQAPLVRLTAALQTAARRPPALALAQRGSLDDLVHVRALLASTLPQVRARTAALRAEVARADRLRDQASLAVSALARSRAQLAERRAALAGLEEEQRRRSSTFSELAAVQSTRALAFSEAARDLSSLAQTRSFQAEVRRQLAGLPPPPLRPGSGAAILPSAAYRIPVDGRLTEGTGELSDAGVHARGLLFAVPPRAQVIAPRAGRILFARPFRDYGGVVVIDHGRGWTTTLTGLADLSVATGRAVAAGEPIGTAPLRAAQVGVELRRNGQPIALTSLVG